MEDFIANINFFTNSNFPIFTAFLLGIISTFDPCPLALNITAISYICNDLRRRWEALVRGAIYTLGRMTMFGLMSVIVFLGADYLKLQNVLLEYGEKIIGFMLVFIGILMFDFIHFHLPFHHKIEKLATQSRGKSYINIFLLGALFSLTFCPHTLVYLSCLSMLCVSDLHTIVLPVSFALGGGIPDIIFAFLIAYCVSNIGAMYSKIHTIETYMRKITAIIFILVGLYFIIENFIL